MTDISVEAFHARMAIVDMVCLMTAPHVLMRPKICPDGNQWSALYGDNLQDGVAGFGDTPALACADFDRNWNNQTLRAGGEP